MWKAYTKTSDSVVVRTTAEALDLHLPQEIMKFCVKYQSLNKPRLDLSRNLIFFHKPRKRKFEMEFRMLRTIGENDTLSAKDTYCLVPISLEKVIHRVIAHPLSSPDTRNKVNQLLQKHCPTLECEISRFASN